MRYITEKGGSPIYLQLYRQIRDDIVAGVYPYGSKLPSKRTLADESGISTVTVEHAYALLCDEGYARARERSGYTVVFKRSDGFVSTAESGAEHIRQSAEPSDYPTFPVSVLSRTMRRVLADYYDVIMQKSPGAGCDGLRGAIRDYLARNRGIHVETKQIVIGSGAEYLYGLIVMLLGKERVYALETPSYEVIERIYATVGVRYELLPLSEDGIDSGALFSSGADVLHTTPYRSFPSGVTASASKRHEYIRWADREGRYIIESDYGSEFAVSSQPMETLFALADRDNVIYLNTFSKTISSSIRVGYMVLPESLTEPYYDRLGAFACTVPTFEQYVLAELIGGGAFERHINRVRRSMRRKLEKQGGVTE